jgi:hypothetical protein
MGVSRNVRPADLVEERCEDGVTGLPDHLSQGLGSHPHLGPRWRRKREGFAKFADPDRRQLEEITTRHDLGSGGQCESRFAAAAWPIPSREGELAEAD